MFGKSVETDAGIARVIIDADKQAKPVYLPPCIALFRKLPNEADPNDVFNPSAIRFGDPISQHPRPSCLAVYFA